MLTGKYIYFTITLLVTNLLDISYTSALNYAVYIEQGYFNDSQLVRKKWHK